MNELGFAIEEALKWFPHSQESPYVLVQVTPEHASAWAERLAVLFRRCYLTDQLLDQQSAKHNTPKATIVAARLPDPGSVMAGDFGEILIFIYQAARAHPVRAIGVKKWRLKQDRTKPAPHSDVLHLLLPSWPTPSARDEVHCAEVKMKSTAGRTSPIKNAIADSAKDRTSRLAKSLVWLRDRALLEDLGEVKVEHLERFINATANPPAKKVFRAVAVICADLIAAELADAPTVVSPEYELVVFSVPKLKDVYTAVFAAVQETVANPKVAGT